MIFKKLKQLVNEFRNKDENIQFQNKIIQAQNAELEWAHIYHDTIRGKEWLKKLAISPGRWAGNYSFFYILVRILSDYKPEKIIELGLGESSKLISSFIKNELPDSTHVIIEQDETWITLFSKNFSLPHNSTIVHFPLEEKKIKNFTVNSYTNLKETITGVFDLYIIDGPFGSQNLSRYDVIFLAEKIKPENEFIILIDDYNRNGEKETSVELINKLNEKGIKLYTGQYAGNKAQLIIATEKYKFSISM